MAQKWDAYFVPFNSHHWSLFYEKAFTGQMIRVYINKLGLQWVLLRDFESDEHMLRFEAQIVPEPGKVPLPKTRNAWFKGGYMWETNDGFLTLPGEIAPLPKVVLAPWLAAQATVSQTNA